MKKSFIILFALNLYALSVLSQELVFQKQKFELKNVTASVAKLYGEDVIKVERDLKALPFDVNKLEATVDEPTYVRMMNFDFENGVIEVKMLSQIQDPSPFQ